MEPRGDMFDDKRDVYVSLPHLSSSVLLSCSYFYWVVV
jgi:hypothetical protein